MLNVELFTCTLTSFFLLKLGTLDILFHHIESFIRFCLAFGFGLQTLYLIDFSIITQLKARQNLVNDLI